jgi:type II secretory pathway component PulM
MAFSLKRASRKPSTVGIHSGATSKLKPAGNPLKKLSTRERVMIVGLLVVVVIAMLLFLIYIPAQENIAALEDREAELQQEYSSYENQIAQTPTYRVAFDSAKVKYNAYQEFFYPFMNPEEVDELITGTLRDNKIDPERLTMTALSEEPLSHYTAVQLVPNAVAEPEEPSNGTETASGGGALGENRNSSALNEVESAAGTAGTTDATGTSSGSATSSANDPGVDLATADKDTTVYVYTIDVQADGSFASLQKYLDKSKSKYGFEIISWSFVEPTAGDILNTGTIQMQIKLYVFLGGPIQ